jgi:uncharacterized membrane protein YphA (DoxX/SURF4 family)
MSSALWVLQVILALAFLAAGANHAFRYDQMKSRPRMGWVGAVSRPMMTFIGICEMLGGIGLILPALTGILPWLTPLAGLGLAAIMLLAGVFHAARREYPAIIFNTVMLVLAAFVAYGRFVVVPL